MVFFLIIEKLNPGQCDLTKLTENIISWSSQQTRLINAALTASASSGGIDAPETKKGKRKPGQPYSQRAKSFLASMVLNKKVDIKDYGKDRYGRILGVVYLDDTDVNLEMIKAGLAEVYRGRQPKGLQITLYREVEKEAIRAKRGMWSLGDKYVSPKVWRKEHKN